MTTLILRCNKCQEPADMLVGGRCIHCEPKKVAYTVRGSWPFPIDMLRHDQSVAATPEDRAMIESMSQAHAGAREDFKDRDIHLLGLNKPNTARWESFGWSVPGDQMHAYMKRERAAAARRDADYQKAMAKLTPAEQEAVKWRARAA
jgi:hypothetical protein